MTIFILIFATLVAWACLVKMLFLLLEKSTPVLYFICSLQLLNCIFATAFTSVVIERMHEEKPLVIKQVESFDE